MKTLILSISLLLASLLTLQSCSKDDGGSSSSSSSISDLTKCKVISTVNSDYKMVYTYNSNGTINTITEYALPDTVTPYDVFTYTYNLGTVTYTNQSGREQGSYTLDAATNKATSSSVTYYNAQDPTQATSNLSISYEYDAKGYLSKQTKTVSSQMGSSTGVYTYIWKDGNMMNEIYASQGGSTTNTAFTYYTDRLNAFSSLTTLKEFTGPASKNLVKTSTDVGSSTVNKSYVYEFDSYGKPVKTFISDGGFNESIVNTFLCQ